jgi:hypothetical protein
MNKRRVTRRNKRRQYKSRVRKTRNRRRQTMKSLLPKHVKAIIWKMKKHGGNYNQSTDSTIDGMPVTLKSDGCTVTTIHGTKSCEDMKKAEKDIEYLDY